MIKQISKMLPILVSCTIKAVLVVLMIVVFNGAYQILSTFVLFYRVEKLFQRALTIEGHSVYDTWHIQLLTNPEAIKLAQQAFRDAKYLAKVDSNNLNVHRQIGRIALLLGEPDQAISAYSKVISIQNNSPLNWLELGLAFEQLFILCLSELKSDSILIDFPMVLSQEWSLQTNVQSEWWTPPEPVNRRVFRGSYFQTYVQVPVEIEDPALVFWIGNNEVTPKFFQLVVNGYTLVEGQVLGKSWQFVQVDLDRWSGEVIELVLSGNSSILGLAEARVISRNAAKCVSSDCARRAIFAWSRGGFSARDFLDAGNIALQKQKLDLALQWYRRANILGVDTTSTAHYVTYLSEGKVDELVTSITLDRGWSSDQVRFSAWLNWGQVLLDQERYVEAERIFRYLIHSNKFLSNHDLSNTYRDLGLSLWGQSRLEEALLSFYQAISVDPSNVVARIDYGKVLYLLDSENVTWTERIFIEALDIYSHPSSWKNIIGFWEWTNNSEYRIKWCKRAYIRGIVEELTGLCQFNP